MGTESVNVQENTAQVPHSKTLLCRVVLDQSKDKGVGIVNAKVEEVVEKVEEVGEEVEADMSESVASGIGQVRERVFLI